MPTVKAGEAVHLALTDGVALGILLRRLRRTASSGRTLRRKPVSVMDQPVEDRVRYGGIRIKRMPLGYRQLSADHCGSQTGPIFDYLQKIPTLIR